MRGVRLRNNESHEFERQEDILQTLYKDSLQRLDLQLLRLGAHLGNFRQLPRATCYDIYNEYQVCSSFGICLPSLNWCILKATAKVPAANPGFSFVICAVLADVIVLFELCRSIVDHL